MNPLRIVSWNMGFKRRPWHELAAMEDPSTHRILAAGDLNMCYGTDDVPPRSLLARERTVWDRMGALGLEFLGPQTPAGRKAHPIEGASNTQNVITYHTTRQTPETARIQLDYAFASRGFARHPGNRGTPQVPLGGLGKR